MKSDYECGICGNFPIKMWWRLNFIRYFFIKRLFGQIMRKSFFLGGECWVLMRPQTFSIFFCQPIWFKPKGQIYTSDSS